MTRITLHCLRELQRKRMKRQKKDEKAEKKDQLKNSPRLKIDIDKMTDTQYRVREM